MCKGNYLEGCYASGELARDNVLRDNQVTGGVSNWSGGSYGWTLSGNVDNVGTSFLKLSGNRPSPYYDLLSDKNGSSSNPNPSTDYQGYSRASVPDVGAFEYATEEEAPPNPPEGLVVSPGS